MRLRAAVAPRPICARGSLGGGGGVLFFEGFSQRLQHPLTKEYTLHNQIRDPTMT